MPPSSPQMPPASVTVTIALPYDAVPPIWFEHVFSSTILRGEPNVRCARLRHGSHAPPHTIFNHENHSEFVISWISSLLGNECSEIDFAHRIGRDAFTHTSIFAIVLIACWTKWPKWHPTQLNFWLSDCRRPTAGRIPGVKFDFFNKNVNTYLMSSCATCNGCMPGLSIVRERSLTHTL